MASPRWCAISVVMAALLASCSSGGGPHPPLSNSVDVQSSPASAVERARVSPCPTDRVCRVLPLGDSITYGVGSPGGGYRVELFLLANSSNKKIIFVGSQENGPDTVGGRTFPKAHDGYIGETIRGLSGRIPSRLTLEGADIVLLHLGTNDMVSEPTGAAGRLGELIGEIAAILPDALIVVAQVIPLKFSSDTMSLVERYNREVAQEVGRMASAGTRVILADHFSGFPHEALSDGVHPDAAGYAFMAGVWFGVIEEYLP